MWLDSKFSIFLNELLVLNLNTTRNKQTFFKLSTKTRNETNTILEAQIQIPCHINKNESTNVTLTGTSQWKQYQEGVFTIMLNI
jgi:hypothetical protein